MLTADSILQPIDRLIASVQSMPWGVQGAIVGVLVGGLILWAFGRKVLRPMAVLIGAGVGGAAGFVALPVLAPEAGLSPYVGLAGGAVIGLLLALLLYRIVTAVSFGFVLACAAAVTTAGVLGWRQPSALPQSAAIASGEPGLTGIDMNTVIDEAARRLEEALAKGSTPLPSSQPASAKYPNISATAQNAHEFYQALRDQLQARWAAYPSSDQWKIGLAAAFGMAIGLLLGFLMPNWSSGAVTALVGAAIWLPAAVWLLHAFSVPRHERLSEVTPLGWAIVWAIVGIIGIGMQWQAFTRAKKKAKPAEEPAPPAAQ